MSGNVPLTLHRGMVLECNPNELILPKLYPLFNGVTVVVHKCKLDVNGNLLVWKGKGTFNISRVLLRLSNDGNTRESGK